MRPCFLILLCKSLVMQLFAVDANQSVFFSQAVLTLQNRRLHGHIFKTFSSPSLITCGLHCNRNPRCASTNFKATDTGEKGLCELNYRGVARLTDEKDMEHEEGVIFTQYQRLEETYYYKSCSQIRADNPDSLSGLYSIQPVPGCKSITVYCEMAIAGGGFTFVPRTAIRGNESQQMISELFTDRTQVLMKIQKKDGTQPYTLVEQLPEYKQHLLGARVNNYDGYTPPLNSHMGDYLLLGVLPADVAGVNGRRLGFQSNGKELNYTNCDGTKDNLFAFLPNYSELPSNDAFDDSFSDYEREGMAVDWRNTSVQPPSGRTMPNGFFFLTEVHMGGCGCYTSSDRWKDANGTAIGFR